MFILLLKILLGLVSGIYVSGLLTIWQYENKKAKVYRLVLARIEVLNHLGLSMATRHAKTFKLKQDYRQWVEMIEQRQQFIFEKVLFLKKSTLKIKNEQGGCWQS
jgi:hypothetical protein